MTSNEVLQTVYAMGITGKHDWAISHSGFIQLSLCYRYSTCSICDYYDGHPQSSGWLPTIPRMVNHHKKGWSWSPNVTRTMTNHSQESDQPSKGRSTPLIRTVTHHDKDGHPQCPGWSPNMKTTSKMKKTSKLKRISEKKKVMKWKHILRLQYDLMSY